MLRLYGMTASMFTAKARAYLRKQHLSFHEVPVGDPSFGAIVAEIGRFIMPVLVDVDGTVVQDTTAIIDHIEASGRARQTAYPSTPRHRILALIFELFGGEGLLRPAMHYRWNFDTTNLAFLRRDFVASLAPDADGATGDAIFASASALMRKAMTSFGVSPATRSAVERSYAEFLRLFDEHLATTPYLLGGHPTIGDYGLVGPLYAHLARDPEPARLMQTGARNVWRWVERMNAPEPMLDGFVGAGETLFADDAVPYTLVALLRFVAEDYWPELAAHIAFANLWLDVRPDLVAGTNGLPDAAQRRIGMASFAWRGLEVRTAVLPYRFWLLQRVQDTAGTLREQDRAKIDTLLREVGLAELVTARTSRRVERVGHLEVWGAPLSTDPAPVGTGALAR
jgi:glutathione S-transferase